MAICPYMVFAANGENRYNAKDFILGNIFGNEELDLSTEIKKFIKHYLMQNTAYKNCGACSKGCYAIKPLQYKARIYVTITYYNLS